MKSTENFYSFHVFFFPFKWEIKPDKDGIYRNVTNMRRFAECLQLNAPSWNRNQDTFFPPKFIPHYNEVNYFYDFVWKALYDDGTDEKFMHHYAFSGNGNLKYNIYLANGKAYSLDIDDVLLHVYGAGVGVLSFHLYNRLDSQSHSDDILNINQYGRRLYAPFYVVDDKYSGTVAYDEYDNWTQGLIGSKNIDLAERLVIESEAGLIIAEDDFTERKPRNGCPKLMQDLLGRELINLMNVRPIGDDRMFVLCWFGNEEIAQKLKLWRMPLFPHDKRSSGYEFLRNTWWYKFIFVDSASGGESCQDPLMQRELLSKHTNSRWLNAGNSNGASLYGACRYSFVALTSPVSKFPLVANHMRSMYYKMVELCLIQRASILKFSHEVTEISNLTPDEGLARHVSNLYKRYIHFVNAVYFREITAQEQGIELYDLLSGHMRIEKDVEKLDREIQELHQYASLNEERRRTKAVNRLTIIGAIFIVPTFIAGYYGMNIFDSTNDLEKTDNWILFAGVVLATILLILALLTKSEWPQLWITLRAKSKWWWLSIVLFILVLLSMVAVAPHWVF